MADWLGLAALLAFAWLTFIDVLRANQALGALFILFLVAGRRCWRELSREPWVGLTFIYLAFIAVHGGVSRFMSPVPSDILLAVSLDFAKLGFLPALVVAYWGWRWPRLIPTVVWLIPLGFVWRVLSRIDGQDLAILLAGQDRATFGDGAVLFGLWSLIILLFGLYHLARALEQLGERLTAPSCVRLAGALGLLGFATVGLAVSQTRTAWVLAAVLVPAQIAAITWFRLKELYGRKGALVTGAFLLGVFGIGLASLSGPVMQRFSGLGSALAALVSGAETGVSDTTSVGLRLQMLHEGWSAWLERPFFGWGAGADDWVLAQSGNEALVSRGFYHLHNDLLIHLVEYGLPGGLIYIALFLCPTVWLAVAIVRSPTWRAEALTLLLSLAALAGGGLTDRVLMSRRGPFVIALVVGLALAIHWLRKEAKRSNASGQAAPAPETDSGIA